MIGKRFVRAAVLAGSMLAGAANAAVIHVEYGFIPFTSGGSITFTGANLGSATSIDFSNVTAFVVNTVSANDRTGVELFDTIGPTFGFANPVANFVLGNQDISALGWTKNWNTSGSASCGAGTAPIGDCTTGAYSGTFDTLRVTSSGPDNLSWVLTGTVTQPDGTTTQADFLTASFTNAGGDSVNVSFTELSFLNVPAPAILGLLGFGLIGLGFARRTRV